MWLVAFVAGEITCLYLVSGVLGLRLRDLVLFEFG
jgi:hypothetical protein